jgi:hypothetical protein
MAFHNTQYVYLYQHTKALRVITEIGKEEKV